mmetsp:Transcript_114016/g.327595  ORF Transcript_114016/g.327595 Transcript_114016/m.327595 type:complete len:385 (+) Transcript_114016:556-1710(+)
MLRAFATRAPEALRQAEVHDVDARSVAALEAEAKIVWLQVPVEVVPVVQEAQEVDHLLCDPDARLEAELPARALEGHIQGGPQQLEGHDVVPRVAPVPIELRDGAAVRELPVAPGLFHQLRELRIPGLELQRYLVPGVEVLGQPHSAKGAGADLVVELEATFADAVAVAKLPWPVHQRRGPGLGAALRGLLAAASVAFLATIAARPLLIEARAALADLAQALGGAAPGRGRLRGRRCLRRRSGLATPRAGRPRSLPGDQLELLVAAEAHAGGPAGPRRARAGCGFRARNRRDMAAQVVRRRHQCLVCHSDVGNQILQLHLATPSFHEFDHHGLHPSAGGLAPHQDRLVELRHVQVRAGAGAVGLLRAKVALRLPHGGFGGGARG